MTGLALSLALGQLRLALGDRASSRGFAALAAFSAALSIVSAGLATSSTTVEDYVFFLRWDLAMHLAAVGLLIPAQARPKQRGLSLFAFLIGAFLSSVVILNISQPFTLRFEYIHSLNAPVMQASIPYMLPVGTPHPFGAIYWAAIVSALIFMAFEALRSRKRYGPQAWALLLALIACAIGLEVLDWFLATGASALFPAREAAALTAAALAWLIAGDAQVSAQRGAGSPRVDDADSPVLAYRCDCDEDRTIQVLTGDWCWLGGKALLDPAPHTLAGQIHAEDRGRVFQEIRQQLERGAPYDVEYRLALAGGGWIWVRDTGQGRYDETGLAQSLQGILLDISTQKNTEARLAASEARFNELLESLGEGLFLIEVAPPLLVDGPHEAQIDHLIQASTVIRCNDSFARAWGLPDASHATGKALAALWEGGGIDVRDRFKRFLRSGYHFEGAELNVRMRASEPRSYLLSCAGVITGDELPRIWGVQWDVTERERSLVDSKRIVAAVEHGTDGIMICSNDGRVLYMNPAFERLSGISEHDALGRALHNLYRPGAEHFFLALEERIRASDFGESVIQLSAPDELSRAHRLSVEPVQAGALREKIIVIRETLL